MSPRLKMSPRAEARGLKFLGNFPETIGHDVTALLAHKVLLAQDLDSSVAEFILSNAEGLLRNVTGRLQIASGLRPSQ